MPKREQLEQAIAALESQRAILGDAVVDTMIAAACQQLAELEPPPEQQRKQVTVLFADVSGFTAMSETMDAEDVSEVMNALWARLDQAIIEHGGYIDKHMGDGVMAIWGVRQAREDDPERAIRAALAMQQEMVAFRELRSIELNMRIGLNTGPVLLGKAGTTGEYTAIGDTVNSASRLEQAAPRGGILISYDCYRHVRGVFNVQPLDPILVKGKTEPIPVYVVLEAKPRAFRIGTRDVEGIETRMIGRQAELQHLQDALYTVMEDGERQMVTVTGGAGVGKSRLLYEFEAWFELLPEVHYIFKGRATQETKNMPYVLIRNLFSFRFQIQDSDSVSVVHEKMEQGLGEALGENAPAQMKIHFIGQLLGFDFSASPHLHKALANPKQIRDRGTIYIADYFKAMAAKDPAMILLEDLHWADDASLDVLNRLALATPDCPLLIVGAARPALLERRPHWGEGQTFHTRLELHPLSKRSSRRLVGEILKKVREVPVALRELVVSSAEGNPFYTEELIKILVEDGVIVKGEDRWRVLPARLTSVRIPPTLTAVLQARLDSLPKKVRVVLQCASVVGRIFWDDAVQCLHTGPGVNGTGEALAALRQRELVYLRETSAFAETEEYIFKHALLHEVTYESVLKRQRRRYHAQVAEWLIEWAGERVAEYVGLIAEHYKRAGETERAGEWYGRAGRQAKDAYAAEEAIDYYQKALAFLPETADTALRVELYDNLGEVLWWRSQCPEAIEAYEAMLEAAEAVGDKAVQARAWNGLCRTQRTQGYFHTALESAERAEELARAAGMQAVLAEALIEKGLGFYELGAAEKALALGEQALALSTEWGCRHEMGDSLYMLGCVHGVLYHYEQATQYFEKALALHRELGDQDEELAVLRNLGTIAGCRGNYQAAAALYQEGLTIAREIGALPFEMYLLNSLGENARLQGEYTDAIVLYQEALTIAREIGYLLYETCLLSNLGGARVGLGEYAAAEADLRQVIPIAEARGWSGITETYLFLAEACLGQEKVEEALAAARMALALGQEDEWQEEMIGLAWRVLGMVVVKLPEPIAIEGHPYNAPACFAESLRIFTETKREGYRARTLREWARYELEQGDREKGKAMWQEARETFERLGMEPEMERMGDMS